MKTYVVTSPQNRLSKTVLMMGHNICFKEVMWTIILKLSIFGLPGLRPGRAIVLPLALALASALAKSLTSKFFYLMGKVLSGKLSCPCDRSCFPSYLEH